MSATSVMLVCINSRPRVVVPADTDPGEGPSGQGVVKADTVGGLPLRQVSPALEVEIPGSVTSERRRGVSGSLAPGNVGGDGGDAAVSSPRVEVAEPRQTLQASREAEESEPSVCDSHDEDEMKYDSESDVH